MQNHHVAFKNGIACKGRQVMSTTLGAMKVETLLLALVVRFFEVGFKEKTNYPQELPLIVQVCKCDCDCAARWILASGGLPSFLALGAFCCKRGRAVPLCHGSPRRKGLGTISVPSG